MEGKTLHTPVGLKYTAFVPVDTSVWQTFWAMKPLFPMPVNRSVP